MSYGEKFSLSFTDVSYNLLNLKYFFNSKYTLPVERKKIVNDFKNTNFSTLNKVLIHDQKTFFICSSVTNS